MINDSNTGSGPGGRSAAFQAGVRGPGNRGPLAFSLMASQSDFNAQVARKYQPKSVLTASQVIPSMSGYSAKDYSRVTPAGVLPSPNGYAPDTYNLINPTQFATKLSI